MRRIWSRGKVAEVGPAEFGGIEPRTDVVRELVRGECGTADDGSDGPLRVREIRLGRDDVAVDGEGLGVAFTFGFSGAGIVGVTGSTVFDGSAGFGGDGAAAARGTVIVVVWVIVETGLTRAWEGFCFFLAGFSDDGRISAAAASGSAFGVSSSLLRFLFEYFASSLCFSFLSFLGFFSFDRMLAVDMGSGEIGGLEKI